MRPPWRANNGAVEMSETQSWLRRRPPHHGATGSHPAPVALVSSPEFGIPHPSRAVETFSSRLPASEPAAVPQREDRLRSGQPSRIGDVLRSYPRPAVRAKVRNVCRTQVPPVDHTPAL